MQEAVSKIVPHRFRHTYATTLLTAGMSLTGIKSLLGHHSLKMTLRYAEVVPEKVLTEYRAALKTMEEEYRMGVTVQAPSRRSPTKALNEIALMLYENNSQKAMRVVKQVERLKKDVATLE